MIQVSGVFMAVPKALLMITERMSDDNSPLIVSDWICL